MKNKVRELRNEKKLRQEDLARQLGVTRQTIIAIENRRYNPSLELAIRLARFFERPVEEVFQLDQG
ncbi:MAG: helix-turn-helix transcriptional regulator [Clostridiaceae bacterium]|nr:helix-turn-helix transcriptional regulator [Clostridiaceae bacterium]